MRQNKEELEKIIDLVIDDICGILEIQERPVVDIYWGNESLPGKKGAKGIYVDKMNLLVVDATDGRTEDFIFCTIAHELRHKWQYSNGENHDVEKPKFLIFIEKCFPFIEKMIYYKDQTEIDAEAFAWKYMRDRFGWVLHPLSEMPLKERAIFRGIYERIKELDQIYHIMPYEEKMLSCTGEDNMNV